MLRVDARDWSFVTISTKLFLRVWWLCFKFPFEQYMPAILVMMNKNIIIRKRSIRKCLWKQKETTKLFTGSVILFQYVTTRHTSAFILLNKLLEVYFTCFNCEVCLHVYRYLQHYVVYSWPIALIISSGLVTKANLYTLCIHTWYAWRFTWITL